MDGLRVAIKKHNKAFRCNYYEINLLLAVRNFVVFGVKRQNNSDSEEWNFAIITVVVRLGRSESCGPHTSL